jgi:amidohydrolase
MRDVDALKARAGQVVDDLREKLVLLSLKLHAEVELAFEEVKASRWITDLLETRGLRVERGLGSLPTAFRATAGSGGPKLAYLCEYDGLPVYGHSCGHNVVAAAGVGAAIALASVIDRLDGTVIALGTPGEEGSGGKYILEREGFFADIDAMMLIYPGMYNVAHSRAVGAVMAKFEFFGRAAHAAARPELGVNALDAMLLAFQGINALRQQLPSDVRVHGIIDKGGTLPQVIPDHTVARIMVRANDGTTLDEVVPLLDRCLEGAALMTGTRLERSWRTRAEGAQPLLSNQALAAAFADNLSELGREVRSREELSGAWSGDTGAISWLVPTIQPQMAMTGTDVAPHSHEFHAASASPVAAECIIDAAKAMAMTGIDLLAKPQLMTNVRAGFAKRSVTGD